MTKNVSCSWETDCLRFLRHGDLVEAPPRQTIDALPCDLWSVWTCNRFHRTDRHTPYRILRLFLRRSVHTKAHRSLQQKDRSDWTHDRHVVRSRVCLSYNPSNTPCRSSDITKSQSYTPRNSWNISNTQMHSDVLSDRMSRVMVSESSYCPYRP